LPETSAVSGLAVIVPALAARDWLAAVLYYRMASEITRNLDDDEKGTEWSSLPSRWGRSTRFDWAAKS